MSATLLLIALLTLFGIPLARAVDRHLRGLALIGSAFLIGSGAATLELFLFSISGIPWRRTWLILGALSLVAVVLIARRWWSPEGRGPRAEGLLPYTRGAFALDLLAFLPILGHAFFATWTELYEWDYFGIWGLKGRFFHEAGAIDWAFVQTNISHPDYPLLVPLLYDLHAVAVGRWDEGSLGLLYTAMAAAVILVARGLLAEEWRSHGWAALGTLAVVFPALNLWIGLAEGMVMAFGCAGLLLIRRGHLPAGAVLLGFAAWSKNEGLALIAVCVVALIVARRLRDALRLWPAVAVIAPWLVTRMVLKLETDFVDAHIIERILSRVREPLETIRVFTAAVPDQPWFWGVVVLCMVIYARRAFTQERFLTSALLLQVLLFVVQGMATRVHFASHVSLTMNRIPHQLAPAFAFLAVVLVMPSLRRATPESSERSPSA